MITWLFTALLVMGLLCTCARAVHAIRQARAPAMTPVTSTASLEQWHAVWERDHPDLITWASFTDYLPSERVTMTLVGDRGPETVINPPKRLPSYTPRPRGGHTSDPQPITEFPMASDRPGACDHLYTVDIRQMCSPDPDLMCVRCGKRVRP